MHSTIHKDDLLKLAQPDGIPCISLYVPLDIDARQNSVRLKNLLREAQRHLVEHGGGHEEMLKPLEQLLERQALADHSGQGFAAFVSPHRFKTFEVPAPLPEQVLVGSRFHFKPLLPFLAQGRFYVLALSQHEVRLLECTMSEHERVSLPNEVPANLEESRRFDDASGGEEGQITDHRRGRVAGPNFGGGSMHGVGVSNHVVEEHRARFLRQVNTGLHKLLNGQKLPLILAGVDDIVHEFREIFEYPHVLEGHLSGNFDSVGSGELHQKACPLAERHFHESEGRALSGYTPALLNGLATSDLEQVLPAAHDGRIATLFVACDQQVFGRYTVESRGTERLMPDHPDAQELLNLAALETLSKGGEVICIEQARLPEPESPIAAIYRY